MAKEKQKMTLNVKRRSESVSREDPPPPVDSSIINAFATGAENVAPPKPIKAVEEKVIRDAFTMPAHDHEKFSLIQKRCLDMGIVVTKSEIVRAGLNHFFEIEDSKLKKIMETVPKLKTGRPNKQFK